MKDAGLYVHLPYCASRCEYCSFVVTTDASSRDAYFGALIREAALVAPEARGAGFDSVYLGEALRRSPLRSRLPACSGSCARSSRSGMKPR